MGAGNWMEPHPSSPPLPPPSVDEATAITSEDSRFQVAKRKSAWVLTCHANSFLRNHFPAAFSPLKWESSCDSPVWSPQQVTNTQAGAHTGQGSGQPHLRASSCRMGDPPPRTSRMARSCICDLVRRGHWASAQIAMGSPSGLLAQVGPLPPPPHPSREAATATHFSLFQDQRRPSLAARTHTAWAIVTLPSPLHPQGGL